MAVSAQTWWDHMVLVLEKKRFFRARARARARLRSENEYEVNLKYDLGQALFKRYWAEMPAICSHSSSSRAILLSSPFSESAYAAPVLAMESPVVNASRNGMIDRGSGISPREVAAAIRICEVQSNRGRLRSCANSSGSTVSSLRSKAER